MSLTQSVSESVTRSPIELLWTAKNQMWHIHRKVLVLNYNMGQHVKKGLFFPFKQCLWTHPRKVVFKTELFFCLGGQIPSQGENDDYGQDEKISFISFSISKPIWIIHLIIFKTVIGSHLIWCLLPRFIGKKLTFSTIVYKKPWWAPLWIHNESF